MQLNSILSSTESNRQSQNDFNWEEKVDNILCNKSFYQEWRKKLSIIGGICIRSHLM